MMNKLLDKLRAAWRSFVAAFDYTPPHELAPTVPADTEVLPERPGPTVNMETAAPAHSAELQALLDRIAVALAHELPPVVTRPMQRADGTWYSMVETDTGNLREPNVIERAVIARAKQLREAPPAPYSPPSGDSRFTAGPT